MFQALGHVLHHSIRLSQALSRVVCVVTCALVVSQAGAQSTPVAGSTINNRAQATYTDSATGRGTSLDSNTVTAQVAQVAAFNLSSSQNKAAAPGAGVRFQHVITNLGNGPDSFTLALDNSYFGSFNFASVQLYADLNSDGVPDNNLPILATPVLTPGQSFAFVALAQVPSTVTSGQEDRVSVTAQSNFGGIATQTNLDIVNITNNAVMSVVKSFSEVTGPSPYFGILVTLTYTNIGNTNASNVTLIDVIGGPNLSPNYNTSGLSYVPNSGAWQGLGLSDAVASDPAGINYQAITVSGITTVQAVVAGVAPGASGSISFRVDVKPNLALGSGTTNNSASLSYFDGNATQNASTNNTVFYTVAQPGADLQLSKIADGPLLAATLVTYRLQVRNTGAGPSSGPITVVDTLPPGASIDLVTNPPPGQWSCAKTGSQVSCSNPASVQAGQAHPQPLLLRVTIDPSLAGQVAINSATVNGGGEPAANTNNNSASYADVVVLGASVSGRAWFDTNHNRQLDPNEPPVPNVIVELLDPNNLLVATTRTDTDGRYVFSNIRPNPGYKIVFRLPDGSKPLLGRPVTGESGSTHPSSTGTLSLKGAIENLNLAPGVNVLEQSLPLDPSGIVYDALTRQPIVGASVILRGPAGFDPDTHLLGGLPNLTQVTGATGYYQFLLMPSAPAGLYQLEVLSPTGYRNGPSGLLAQASSIGCSALNCLDPTGLAPIGTAYSVQPANLAPAPPTGQDTTYFLQFFLDPLTDPHVVNNHIPLDPINLATPGLFLQKIAGRTVAQLNEVVPYVLKLRNSSTTVFPAIGVTDALPLGFNYVPGTARLDGQAIPDPRMDIGNRLQFDNLTNLNPNTTVTLTYVVRVVPGAVQGDGINRAQARSASSLSNLASAKVRIDAGIFSAKGYLLGKVFVDCNNNHVQDREELGIPGVRLFMQDGSFVITDSEGKYSFAGLAARTQVIKLDDTTLPNSARMAAISNRHGAVGGSRFVDLKNGELHRADFAETSCSDALVAAVQERRKKGEVFGLETERALTETLVADGKSPVNADPRGLPAAGLLTKIPLNAANAFQIPIAGPSASTLGATSIGSSATASVQSLLENADNSLGFLELKDRDTLPIAQTTVRVKGTLGAAISLTVNGSELPAGRIGARAEVAEKQLQYREYVGVSLKPGENTLVLSQKDSFGNQRGIQTITLIAPDGLGKILIDLPSKGLIGDGRTASMITVRLTDNLGVAVTVRTALTLEASKGRWEVVDQDLQEPGVQVFITGGAAQFSYIPPLEPGDVDLRISSGVLKGERRVAVLPELRPLIAAGVLEGIINARNFNASQLIPARQRDGFEAELRRFSRENGAVSSGARAAFFLKGKVKGEYLLTLAYDSEKDVRERLFRDIQPQEFYPVYGDAAVRGFDAQSTSRLYLRIDKNKSYLLWGDFSTASIHPAQRLAQYQRALTGAKYHLDTDRVVVDTFVSRDTVRLVVKEFPAIGTSGPFELGLINSLINSERVEMLVRDRNQPAIVLRSQALVRFADYELEPLSGRIWLKAPLASVDAQLNPISIRVSTEVDQGGKAFWVGGASAQVKLTDTLTLGGVLVRNTNSVAENFSTLAGVNLHYKPSEKTTLEIEAAQTRSLAGDSGTALRAEWVHNSDKLRFRVHGGRAERSFDNPSSTLSKGREEAGARVDWRAREGTVVAAEVLHTKDLNTGASRDGVLASVEQHVGANVKVEVGARQVHDTAPNTATRDTTSLRAKATLELAKQSASVYAEAEQDIHDSSKRMFAVGGAYQFAAQGKIYARHEFVSSLQGAFALNATQRQNATVLGISTDYMNNGSVFSEYRARDAFDQRTTEAAIGLRNVFELAPGLRMNTAAEKVKSLSGGTENEALSLAVGVEYIGSEFWKGSTKMEYRDATTNRSWLHTLGLGAKLARDWTILGKHTYSDIDTKAQGAVALSERLLQRSQIGLAYRQTDTNKLNALTMLEHKRERDTANAAAFTSRQVWLASAHANYQPWRSTVFSANYAVKQASEGVAGITMPIKSRGDWAAARVTYDVSKRWDASVQASVLRNRDTGIAQRGLGAEIGYMLKDDVWLSLGYNRFGYNDKDLTAGQYTDKGVYLRLRVKFDEDLFGKRVDPR
jgi:large repetitive protein